MVSPSDLSKPAVQWQRWWILCVFSLQTMWSCAIWNTFGPIAETVKEEYHWTDGTLSQFTLWAVLDFPLFFLPSAYLLSWSLRYSVVLASLCTVVGPTIRCLPLWFPSLGGFTVLCHLGAFINGIGGPILMSAPIQISATWFPPNERTRATSISQMFNAVGVGISFLLGNFIVSQEDSQAAGDSVTVLLSVYSGVAVLLLILVLAYFPNKPATPPSNSATENRMDFWQGFKTVIYSRNCWLITASYAISQGLVQMWQSTMVMQLTNLDLDLTEQFSSTLGIVISFSAVGSSILVATLMDYFRKNMKAAILLLLGGSGVLFILSTLLLESVITLSHSTFKIVIYIVLVGGVSLACSMAPIAFEFCVELCYPVHEGAVGNWLVLWFNALSAVYFGVFQIPGVGTKWMNFVLPFVVIIPMPIVFLIDEQYKRSVIDE